MHALERIIPMAIAVRERRKRRFGVGGSPATTSARLFLA
jgi:hypothetical protein